MSVSPELIFAWCTFGGVLLVVSAVRHLLAGRQQSRPAHYWDTAVFGGVGVALLGVAVLVVWP